MGRCVALTPCADRPRAEARTGQLIAPDLHTVHFLEGEHRDIAGISVRDVLLGLSFMLTSHTGRENELH